MKILLIHPNELVDYHLERLVKESLDSLEHEVVLLKYRGVEPEVLRDNICELSNEVDFALILKGELLKQEHYDALKCFSGIWYVDHPKDGTLPDWLIRGCSNVDFVFASSYGLLESLEKHNPNCHWLVEGAHLPLLQPAEEKKEYDLAFFGTLVAETNNGDKFGKRWEFLKQVDENYNLHIFGKDSSCETRKYKFKNPHESVWNEQLAKEIARSKIVLGYNSTNQVPLYWSNRTYTTLACKGFLITPYVPGLERVFENHKELVWFYDGEEFHRLIRYYLNNKQQREEIAEQGHKKVRAIFSTTKQIEKMLSIISKRIEAFGKKRKVLFVTDSGYVGCLNAAEHWSALLRSEGVIVEHLVIDEPIATAVCDQYDVVIVSGYSGKYVNVFESSAKKYVVWQSSILQTQLEDEVKPIKLIKKLEQDVKIDGVLCGDDNALVLFSKPIWVPNFSFFKPKSSTKKIVDEEKFNIAALGPSKARKNLFTVLSALERLNETHVVHINVSEDFFKENIEGVFNTDRIVNHGWLEKDDYCALIKQCDVGIQLSVAESYDYVAAEHLLLGTPIICSKSVPAVPIKDLLVEDPENSGELLAKIDVVKRATRKQRAEWLNQFVKKDRLRLEKAKQQLLHYIVNKKSAPIIIEAGRPPLSIVYHGRNDNYAGDFKRRLSWSMQTVQEAFKRLQPEIIFVCWNNLPNTPDLFEDPLFKGKVKGIKVYNVPSSVHDELAKKFDYDGVYLEWFAKNFGIRRATGEYILQLNSDNIIIDSITDTVLPPKDVTYIGNRTEVDKGVLDYSPNKIDTKLLSSLSGRVLRTDITRPYYVGGSCGEFVLTHRDNWHEICGNVEIAGRYCIDNVTATHLRMISRLEIFPFPIYHIAHKSAVGDWPGFDFELGYSGPNWGLTELQIEPKII